MACNIFKFAFAVLVLGWAPILIYIAVGSVDGNPIGLGLLAWMSTVAALALAAASGILFLVQNRRDSSAKA